LPAASVGDVSDGNAQHTNRAARFPSESAAEVAMTPTQERAIALALNILDVSFFECPKHFYEYFISNDEWALLMAAGEVNAVGTPPPLVAVEVLRRAVARDGFFQEMSDFKAPRHFCSFLLHKNHTGERQVRLEQCEVGQATCPYATFEAIQESGPSHAPCRHNAARATNEKHKRQEIEASPA